MESSALSVNYCMQSKTATLAQQVLERAKSRKLDWPLPSKLRRLLRKGTPKDDRFAAAFASFADHMGCISAGCENYYCSVPPFQFEEREVAHIFRYHSRGASEKLLRAFENMEKKNVPVVEESKCPDTKSVASLPATSPEPKDIIIEMSPGIYTISSSSHDDTVKQTHLVQVQPGESIKLCFDL